MKTEVTVIITDVNDEIPTFRSDSYLAEVNENAQANTPITFLNNAVPEVFDHDQVTVSHSSITSLLAFIQIPISSNINMKILMLRVLVLLCFIENNCFIYLTLLMYSDCRKVLL